MIIKNGLVVLPGEDEPRKLDIRVTGEVITAIGGSLDGGHGPVIDADGLYILPGAVDPHVHFDDPGYTEREDFDHGTAAAAGGGVTTVIDMPCTSVPPVTSAENLARKLAVISREARVDYGLFGGVCGTMVPLDYEERMSELAPDVLGYKCYLVSGMETFPRLDHAQLELVLRSAASLRMPVLVHAEDHDYIRSAEKLAAAHGDTPYDYYRSRPEIAEILGIRIAVGLAEECGTELHIVHVASAGAAGSLASPLVTAETGPHYLEFDLGDFEEIGSPLKVTPPVKSSINKYLLWKLLREDTINFIASDHAPPPPGGKETGSIWTDYAGIPGTGTLLPYMFSEGYSRRRISLSRLTAVTSSSAAKRYGLWRRKGSIDVGKDADLVFIDPKSEWVVRGDRFLSKGHITPFEGFKFKGRIVRTVLRGSTVYDYQRGIIGAPGRGIHLKRGTAAGTP